MNIAHIIYTICGRILNMKKNLLTILFTILVLTISANTASAVVYQNTFTPTPADLYDLDHYKYYTWGFNWTLPAGREIVSATLSIKNINNWQVEQDALYIHLLDYAALGVTQFTDNQGGGDNFASWAGDDILLDTFTDQNDYPGPAENYVFNFNAQQLALLKQYSLNDGRLGFGFDPDCHYWNDGVKFKIITQTVVPEPATSLLFVSGMMGALGLRRKKLA